MNFLLMKESDSNSKLAKYQYTQSPLFSALQTDRKNTIIKTKVRILLTLLCALLRSEKLVFAFQ